MMRARGPRVRMAPLGLLAAVTFAAVPCDAAPDARLVSRLDATTAAAVVEIVDGASQRGLPTEPLVARALEGASRRVPGPRIVESVRNLSAGLLTSRERLGPGSSAAELTAGAAALAAGVPPDTLSALRIARGRGSAVVPLVVLVDLVTREVPVETASAAVLAATRANAPDDDLMALRMHVDDDIRGGAPPARATMARTRSLIRRMSDESRVGSSPEGVRR